MARDYSAEVRRRNRLERKIKGYLCFAGCVAAILLVSLGITKIIDRSSQPPELPEESPEAGVVSTVLAPLPMENSGERTMVEGQFGPVQQTGSYTLTPWDAQTIRLAKRGQVSLEYFADAAFLGDSITTGFIDYKTNLGGAKIYAYRGIGPDSIVKRAALSYQDRKDEIPLDLLAAQKPAKLYVLLGSNSLTVTGNEEPFLAYYGKMLDELQNAIGPEGQIYVQSIPPVRPEVTAKKPGLEKERIKAINQRLAQLAEEKGCAYLDLWEVLADENGDMRAECAETDGIHFHATRGYGAWVDYLRSHTVYESDTPWTPGTEYYLDPAEEADPASDAADAAPQE